jgi:hypothetical protein
MSASYPDRSKARFTCDAARNHWGEPQCQALGARPLETLVTRQVLLALEPASLELSLAAVEQIEQERQRLERQQQQSLERTRYEAERARRQYTAVEPEHRLVVRELERRWEAALQEQRQAEEALDRFRSEQPLRLTDDQRQRIRDLATRLPTLWHLPTTKVVERQTIVRQLIDRVEVSVIDGSERVDVAIHWAGGYQSRHDIRRRVASYRSLHDSERLLNRVVELKQQGLSHPEVARRLNSESFRAPQGGDFSAAMISFLWRKAHRTGRVPEQAQPLTPCWRGGTLARHLGIPAATLNTWRRRGWVQAQRRGGWWIYWADAAELARLNQLRRHPRAALQRAPVRLTTPVGVPPWMQTAREGKP